MSQIDQTGNEAFTICWARGDNDARTFTITDGSGNPIDISTWTLQLTVSTERNPDDASEQIFAATGVPVTDGSDGQVSFQPAAGALDSVNPGTAFYDIARTAPDVKTLIKGKVEFIQDIGK